MRQYDRSADIFLAQLRRDWPNLSNEQCEDLAQQRDAGIAAANRLVSTTRVYAREIPPLLKAIADATEAVRLLTLQGLPWAFKRARRALQRNMSEAIDRACDSAYHCAMRYDPSKGCLTTLIAKDIYFKGIRRITKQAQSAFLVLPMTEEQVDDPSAREERQAAEERRQRLHNLINSLPDERERKILTMRADGMTLRDVAYEIGCTKERIRQLESRAIRELKVKAGTATRDERVLYRKHQRGLRRIAAQRAKAMA